QGLRHGPIRLLPASSSRDRLPFARRRRATGRPAADRVLRLLRRRVAPGHRDDPHRLRDGAPPPLAGPRASAARSRWVVSMKRRLRSGFVSAAVMLVLSMLLQARPAFAETTS